jgi:hypothetical protein
MSLSSIVSQYRQELLRFEQQAEHAIRMKHYHMLATIQPHIDQLLRQLKDAQAQDKKVPLVWLYQHNRLQTTKQVVKQGVNQFGSGAKAQVLNSQQAGVGLGLQSATAQLATINGGAPVNTPSQAKQSKIVGVTQQGKPIDDLMDGFGDEAAVKTGRALISGVSMGKEPDWISSLITTALLISLSRALTIDRTSIMESYRESVLITIQDNSDIAQLWIWRAFPGACAFCSDMDGTAHSIDEDMSSHPNCRCQMMVET